MKAKRVSLDDIAKSLGVSKALVSLVINGKAEEHGIAQATSAKVLKKANELNYRPNHFARGLRMGKSFTIGLIVSDISNPFYSQMARYFEDMAELHGYTLITTSTDEQFEREKKLLKMLRERQVDGVLVSSSLESPEQWKVLQSEGLPIVLIDREFKGLNIPTVVVDNFGALSAAKHLLDQGFSNPMALAITPIHISTIENRINGFSKALFEAGIKPVIHEIPFAESAARVDSLITSLHENNNMPDSIFALNNYLATAALDTLRKLDVNVPEQMGLVCFDDVPYFNFMHPRISAISQPIWQICEKAFELLINQIDEAVDDNRIKTVTLPVDLVIRESSIKPK